MYGALPARLKVPTSLSHQKKAILVNLPPENSFIVNPRKNNAHFTCVASRYLATEPWKNIEQAIIAALDAQAFKHPLHRCRVTSKSEFLPDSTSGDLQLLVDRHTEGLLKDIHISIADLAKKNLPMKVALWLSDQDEWKGRGLTEQPLPYVIDNVSSERPSILVFGTRTERWQLWRPNAHDGTTDVFAAKRVFIDSNGLPPTTESNRKHLEDEITRQAIAGDILLAFQTVATQQRVPIYPLEVASSSLLVVTRGNQAGWSYLVEPLLPGAVVKFSGTEDAGNHSMYEMPGATCDSFAHFSLVYTQGELAIVDINGMFQGKSPGSLGEVSTLVLFDLQTQTVDGDSGLGDMGLSGIKKFEAQHRCREMCHGLGLTKNELTRPPSEFMSKSFRKQVRGGEMSEDRVSPQKTPRREYSLRAGTERKKSVSPKKTPSRKTTSDTLMDHRRQLGEEAQLGQDAAMLRAATSVGHTATPTEDDGEENRLAVNPMQPPSLTIVEQPVSGLPGLLGLQEEDQQHRETEEEYIPYRHVVIMTLRFELTILRPKEGSILIFPAPSRKVYGPAMVQRVETVNREVTLQWLDTVRWARSDVPADKTFVATIAECSQAENLMVRNKSKLAKLNWPRVFDFPTPDKKLGTTTAMEHVASNLPKLLSILSRETDCVVMDDWDTYTAQATTRRAEQLTFEFVEPRQVKGLFEDEKDALDNWVVHHLGPALLMKFSDETLRQRLTVGPGTVLTNFLYVQAILQHTSEISIDELYRHRVDLVRGEAPLVFRAWDAMKSVYMVPIHEEGALAVSHRVMDDSLSVKLPHFRLRVQAKTPTCL
ncbi:hypothetical protein CALCODRAFT_507538 [Calocera cornea HHB12733]|uniref:Alpha-type protein kinase domain-containing protein n=1 Tax=Calocera cornea HHB12733 TaxID=1353952 RepID=A0A165HNB8_9BASI|nr:hypothetical protein CALCODRAFT_507538 [Calocera cornea HHB12733]